MRHGYQHIVLDDFVARLKEIRAKRAEALVTLKTRDDALAYQTKVRSAVAESFGPWPQKCALDAVTTGVVACDGYRIEKVRICSRPDFWVTMNLYVPDGLTAAAPAAIGLMGHAQDGKACGEYQRFAIRLVRNGFIVLMVDPLEQGERVQYNGFDYLGQAGSLCRKHNVIGKQLELLGESFASWRVWDAKCALDYLLTRPEVDPKRIGVTGNSGGGTTTEWFWANDDRLAFAAPNCHVTTFLRNLENELPTDAEQCPFGIIGAGLEMVDLMFCQVPKPVCLLGEKYDFFERRGLHEAYEDLRHFYSLFGAEDNVRLFIGPTKHCYSEYCQPEMVRFFYEQAGLSGEVREFVPKTLPKEQTYVCGGDVVAAGSRPVYDLMSERAASLETSRQAPRTIAEWRDTLKRLLVLLELPAEPPHYRCLRATEKNGVIWARFAVETERLLRTIVYKRGCPGECFNTLDVEDAVDVYLPNFGSEEDLLNCAEMAAIQPDGVLYSLDVRGLGESMPDEDGDFHTAYGMDFMMHSFSLMFGESYLGRRVFDVLRVLSLLKAEGASVIRLHGRGQGALLASYAAMLCDDVTSVTLYDAPESYREWLDAKLCDWPAANIPRGVLKAFDLPDLYRALGNRLEIRSYWNAFMNLNR